MIAVYSKCRCWFVRYPSLWTTVTVILFIDMSHIEFNVVNIFCGQLVFLLGSVSGFH